jgi:hypothetical protein
MWLVVVREPRPDAPYWSGRRWLAAMDAVLWPLLLVVLVKQIEQPVGIVGPMAIALALLCAINRLHRALWMNHRYWFTTWRWGKVAAGLMFIGACLKVLI